MVEVVRAAEANSQVQPRDFVVAMLGARMHYAVPRIWHAAGRLMHMFTDLCLLKGAPRALNILPRKLLPSAGRRMVERVPRGVPPEMITAFTGFGLRYALRVARAGSPDELTRAFLWGGQEFCRLVLRSWPPGAQALFAYNSAALELLQHARQNGLHGILEQSIAPKRLERRLLAEEAAAHPGWEETVNSRGAGEEYAAREEAEWQEADLILCGSEFVKDGIRACGGPVDRVAVVPYGVDTSPNLRERRETGGPLRVLTVGAVGLRKGSPYVLEAARLLDRQVEFRMVGPVGVSDLARSLLSRHVEIVGPVTRPAVAEHYRWADVFLLPSLCEGSATATYEALSWGLPVVCTPNTGSVVRDGVDGFIVPIRDGKAIAERIERLARSQELWAEMSNNARERALEFSLERYGQRLLAALDDDLRART